MPMKKVPTEFARRLKALREAAGLTQEQLAEAAGLNRYGLAKLEQGVGQPHWPTVLALAKALGVSVAAFAGEEEPAADSPGEGPSAPGGDQAEGGKKKRRGRLPTSGT
jgi:transcriptional regulator with XRE-family HTH domain